MVPMGRDYDLVCFDMDGTLTRVRSTWKWVHDCLGVDNEANYQAFINQEIDEPEFMRRDIAGWKGAKQDISETDLIKMFHDIPLIEGIQETVATLKDNGMTCVIISGGLEIAAKMLMNEFGFDEVIADHVETDGNGVLTGEGIRNVDLSNKGLTVKEFIKKYNTTPERTVSIGNSFTDISMFQTSGLSIAMNPTDPYTSEAANHTVVSENIADVLDYILPQKP